MSGTPFRDPALYRSKGADRININNLLAAVCVTVLTLIVSLPNSRPSPWSVIQLAIAIPCLVSSSLCYAKFAYRPPEEMSLWDAAGWITHSIGYICVLNATAVLLAVAGYKFSAIAFIAVNILLFIAYAWMDIAIRPGRTVEKVVKSLLYIALMALGAILPLVLGVS